ncbi:MAG: PQQ-like beta-propeller repeat protein, partial [Planctomycetaceae bacterium]|nr:PQQ-like beta-propeller repeat protein [Planctomycetaceae bacterium]
STLPEEQAPSLTSRLLISNQELSEIAPAALGKAIFWSEPGGIRAVRYDGAPLWPSGEYLNDDLVYESGGDLTSVPEFPLLGHGLRQISVDNGRLIALLGSQIAIEARREPRSLESRLVCLDIADGEGKLLWSHSPSEALPSAEWRFSGPPVMRHDRVYVPVRRARPINAVGVVCLDAHNGDKLWFEQVAGLLSEPPETYHVVCADGLTIAYERVFLGGDFGALACLDVRTGRIEWVRRDEPVPWRVPPRVPEAESAGRRPLCYRGRTFTIEQDDSTVMSVDAWTGAMLWRRTLPAKLTTLVDARHGFLYAVGDHLWALDLETGAVLWRFGLDDVEGEFLGQAVLVGSTAAAVDTSASLLACTHDELWQINALSGAPERRIPLRELYNLAGGRLIPLSNRLLLVTPHQLAMLEWVGLSALPPIH